MKVSKNYDHDCSSLLSALPDLLLPPFYVFQVVLHFTRPGTLFHFFYMIHPLSYSLFFSFSVEILFSGLILLLYLAILAAFFSSIIALYSVTDKVSCSYSIALYTQAEYNLSFSCRSRIFLVSEGCCVSYEVTRSSSTIGVQLQIIQ